MSKNKLKGLDVVTAVCFIILLCYFYLSGPPHLLGLQRIKFEHFTIEDGLPQNSVFCILQDSRGFLWLGTEDGICRYDGYSFKPYQYEPEDPSSLSNNRIHCILEDRSGNLWIGTEEGLNRFDRLREQFRCFKHDPENPEGTLSNNTIRTIIEDGAGLLWIGTNNGLNKFNPREETFKYFHPPLLNADESMHHEVSSLCEDSTNILWVGTGGGLYVFDRQEERFIVSPLPPANPGPPQNNYISTIYEDPSKTLWIGTKNGRLLQLDGKTQRFTPFRYDPQIFPYKSEHQVLSIFEDRSGDFWIGVYNAGLYRLDRQNKTFSNYKELPWITDSLSSNHIYTIYQDRGGIIWIGTEDGLNKLDKKKNEFLHWTTEAGNLNSLSDNNVWAIHKDKSGALWIGTDKGLNRFDRDLNTFTHYKNDPRDPKTLSNDRVMVILEDHLGVLWVGTQGGGLNRLDRKTGTFIHYAPDTEKSGSLSHEKVFTLLEDHLGTLWVGTYGGGLNQFHRDTKTFTHYKPQEGDSGSLSHGVVHAIFEDKGNNLWIGTGGGGLNQFNRRTGTFAYYKYDPQKVDSLSANKVSVIYEDQRGTLWVGTYEGGLNQLVDSSKGTFINYRKKDGLPNDTIFGILEDKQGNLWISTVNGLAKFNPQTGEFKNYFASDGLQSNEFNGGAYYKANDGEMFFGGMKGFNAFYPDRIIENPHQPPVVITGFLVFNKPFLETSITEMDQVVLSHTHDVFSIEFSALDFSIPEKNKYLHKMERVDPDWVEGNSKQRLVNYTKLSPGKYVFRVKGSNNDGKMSREEASLTIIITPPFWQTWWFRIILVVLFILTIFGIYRLRTQRLRKKLAQQQRIQEILKESHDEMERAKDLAELRHAENEKLLGAISSIFIAVDANGIIFQWNKPSENFFGIPANEVEKHPFVEVLKDYINEDILDEIIARGLRQDKYSEVMEFNVDLKSRGKGIRVLAAGISPIRDSAGRTLGFLLLAEDISNRKEEEMLRNLSKKLESLGQMASSIAHEIKTPLQYIGHNAAFVSDSFNEVAEFYGAINVILRHLEQTDNKEIPQKIKELAAGHDMEFIMAEIPKAAEQIISGVTRVSDIIQSMNEFSHPGRGYKEKVDINQLLKTTLVMVQSKIKRNADIELELCQQLPPIFCFAGELNQVFVNILINALDAIIETGRWGIIKVSTLVEEDEVLITISDTGCGIPSKNKEHIFTPFFTTKEMGKGTGQGLSLAHHVIIEKHRGKLDYTSQKNKGTTFYIRLPIEGEP